MIRDKKCSIILGSLAIDTLVKFVFTFTYIPSIRATSFTSEYESEKINQFVAVTVNYDAFKIFKGRSQSTVSEQIR